MEAEARVRQASGDAAGAADAWNRYDAFQNAHRAAYRKSVEPHDRSKAGMLYGVLGEWTGASLDAAPMRSAEYAAIDQLGIAAISTAAMLLAALFAAMALVAWLRTPSDGKPMRLFVGWRRLGWIIMAGAVLPLAIYLVYARLTPLGGRAYGLNETLARVVGEYAALTAAVILLLMALTRRAIRQRAAELGLSFRGPRDRSSSRQSTIATAATLAAACFIVIILILSLLPDIPAVPRKREWLVPVVPLVLCWISIAVAAVVVQKGRARAEIARRLFFGGTVARSAFAVTLLAATVISLVGLPLRIAESRNVAAAVTSPETGKPRLFLSELNAAWRDRRDAAIAQRSTLLRESH